MDKFTRQYIETALWSNPVSPSRYTAHDSLSNRYNAISAEDGQDVAQILATRCARRVYGRRGVAVTVRESGRCGSTTTYDVFVGTRNRDRSSYSGRNVQLYVTTTRAR
jgi:hypothetical protein